MQVLHVRHHNSFFGRSVGRRYVAASLGRLSCQSSGHCGSRAVAMVVRAEAEVPTRGTQTREPRHCLEVPVDPKVPSSFSIPSKGISREIQIRIIKN